MEVVEQQAHSYTHSAGRINLSTTHAPPLGLFASSPAAKPEFAYAMASFHQNPIAAMLVDRGMLGVHQPSRMDRRLLVNYGLVQYKRAAADDVLLCA